MRACRAFSGPRIRELRIRRHPTNLRPTHPLPHGKSPIAHLPDSAAAPAHCTPARFCHCARPSRASPILRSEPQASAAKQISPSAWKRFERAGCRRSDTTPTAYVLGTPTGEGSEYAPAQPNLTCGRLFRWRPLWRPRSLRSAWDARASFPAHPPASPPDSSPNSIPR